jgi:hypothetical protein
MLLMVGLGSCKRHLCSTTISRVSVIVVVEILGYQLKQIPKRRVQKSGSPLLYDGYAPTVVHSCMASTCESEAICIVAMIG